MFSALWMVWKMLIFMCQHSIFFVYEYQFQVFHLDSLLLFQTFKKWKISSYIWKTGRSLKKAATTNPLCWCRSVLFHPPNQQVVFISSGLDSVLMRAFPSLPRVNNILSFISPFPSCVMLAFFLWFLGKPTMAKSVIPLGNYWLCPWVSTQEGMTPGWQWSQTSAFGLWSLKEISNTVCPLWVCLSESSGPKVHAALAHPNQSTQSRAKFAPNHAASVTHMTLFVHYQSRGP